MHSFEVGQWVVLTESVEITSPEGKILLPQGLPGTVTTIGQPDYPNYGEVVGVGYKYYGREFEVGMWVKYLLDMDLYTERQRATLN